MIDIPQYKTFTKIEYIDKGWSRDKKYYVETIDGNKLLLRLSDVSAYDRKKEEYEMLLELSKLGLNMSMPIDFGVCCSKSKVYMLLTWIDGETAQFALSKLKEEKQYALGYKAGEILRKLHTIPAPVDQLPWNKRYNLKIDKKIYGYQKCGIKHPVETAVLKYIEDNRNLLDGKRQVLQHGDYHVGNMIITNENKIGIIDFNRFDYGDPWEEFNRIVFSISASISFSNGQIHGYFEDEVPDEFFKSMALYMAVNSISSIPWALQFGQDEVDNMLKNIDDMLSYYDNFKSYIPSWYAEKS